MRGKQFIINLEDVCKYYTMGEWRIGGVKSTITVERQQSLLMTPEKM